MAVSKRLRFEILRRDGYRCHYCKSDGGGNPLTVDHVIPTALGGSDDPVNLVAACADCNAGKSASSPDAPVVAAVAEDAVRWAAAIQQAAQIQEKELGDVQFLVGKVRESWLGWHWEATDGTKHDYADELPGGWEQTVEIWFRSSVTLEEIAYAIGAAMGNKQVKARDLWRYTCGVVWRRLERRQELARELLTQESEPAPAELEDVVSAYDDDTDYPSPADERWAALLAEYSELEQLLLEGFNLVQAAKREWPDVDFVEIWYGYPRFTKRYGEGIKHRMLRITHDYDFSNKDEQLTYSQLAGFLRATWERDDL